MIQIISDGKKYNETFERCDVVLSTFELPRSLDEFDINIIDLQSREIWKNSDLNYHSIDRIKDFINIKTMVSNRNRSNVVVLFPKNYSFAFNSSYSQFINLRDMLNIVQGEILTKLVPITNSFIVYYENTTTIINGNSFNAAFYFQYADPLTQSDKSLKTTTIEESGIYLTTLDVLNKYDLFCDFLREIKLLHDKEEQPEWLKSYQILDDDEQQENITKNMEIIERAQSEINESDLVLEKNKWYKSILYTNGNDLVEVIFSILEEILNYDLSAFEDKKREDFEIKKEGCTFIGEIKGVNECVKSKHISQLENHYQDYIDSLDENGVEETVKGLLIINHQKKMPLKDRQPVHNKQIELAKRNGSLIIETPELLKLFELFKKGEITSEQCQEMFATKTGLFKLDEVIKTKTRRV